MIDPVKALILGAVQGLTEFLPVSSSGHLVIAGHLLGLKEPPLFFDLLLHGATLLAIVVVLRKSVLALLRATGRLPGFLVSLLRRGTAATGEDPEAWTVLLIAATTAVTGTIGIVFKDPLAAAFNSLPLVSATLVLTGFLLFFSRRFSLQRGKPAAQMTLRDALLIGLMQGAAILPGLSRSGTTIATALFLGFDRKLAGEYSFLISLPAIAGAILLESRHGLGDTDVPLSSILTGTLAAFLLGTISLMLLLRWVRSGRLTPFAYYCWSAGLFAAFLAA
jgi:undecaprenyl-diphosphatase